EYALGEQQLAHLDRLGRLAQNRRDDGRLAREWLEPQGLELLAKITGVLVQPGDQLGVALDVAHRGERAPRDGGREGVGKKLRPRPLGQVIRERGGARREAAGGSAQRLAQRRRDD